MRWNGHLFPSRSAADGHITGETIWNRFADLVERAPGVPEQISGEKVVPKMARRFWYNQYSTVLDSVLEGIDEIAAEQGSRDPEVVMQNYLSEDRARELRRNGMRDRLAEAFGNP